MPDRQPLETQRTDADPSPLDAPLNSTYLGVIVIEVLIILLLVVVGRIFS